MSRDPMEEWIDQACEADAQDIDIDEFDDLPAGPPLSIEEIGQAHADLAQWQTPETFKVLVDGLCARCTSKDWFNSQRLKFLHDAFVLARFARAKAAQSVRLAGATEPWPDGFVRLNGTVHNIEVTSTHGGRRLGDEYRELKGPTMDPVENWVARANSIPKHLDKAVAAKIRKHYGSPCWLVVYLNISEYGIRQKETEVVIEEVKARYGRAFEAIAVHWKGQLY